MILLLIFSILIVVYSILMLFLTFGWIKIKRGNNRPNDTYTTFTIVVAIRNEAINIAKLLDSFTQLDYPSEYFEIVLIDDSSNDNTIEIIKNHQLNSSVKLLIAEGSGKKSALTQGVNSSIFNYIVCTDGDCSVPKQWLNNFNNEISNKGSKFISAPVIYKNRSFLNFEFLGLVAIGASSLRLGFPTMANGANLCFSKDVFEEVKGYQSTKNVASGDDEFLLHKVYAKYPTQVSFLKNRSSIVETNAPSSVSEFFNQRVRWASKWRNYGSIKNALPSIYLFMMYFVMLLYLFFNGFDEFFIQIISVKIISETLFMYTVLSFFQKKKSLIYSVLSQLYYPIYILVIALRVMLSGNYKWKERIVK